MGEGNDVLLRYRRAQLLRCCVLALSTCSTFTCSCLCVSACVCVSLHLCDSVGFDEAEAHSALTAEDAENVLKVVARRSS